MDSGNLHEQSLFFDGFSASHSCSFNTSRYLVSDRHIVTRFFISLIIELAVFVQLVKRSRRVEWGGVAQSTKKRRSPLRTWESNYLSKNSREILNLPVKIITHKRLLTVSFRSRMSDASGKHQWRTQAKLEWEELFSLNWRPPYSLYIYIKSFQEARRAKPLMSWRSLYLRKSAKKLRFHMCYILSIERELLRTTSIHVLF